MKTDYKKGDKVSINEKAKIQKVYSYIKESVIFRGVSVDFLIELCSISSRKSYVVIDVCRGCRKLQIKLPKKQSAWFGFKDIK